MTAAAQSYMGTCKSEPSDMKFQQRMGPLEGRSGDPLLGGGRQAIYGGDSLPSRLDYRQLLVLLR